MLHLRIKEMVEGNVHPWCNSTSPFIRRLSSIMSCFYTGQQAANLAVLFAEGGILGVCLTPRRENFFPPPLLSKSKPLMCRQSHETGRGVDDLHCCATHSWSQQSVHHFIRGRQDEQLDSCWDPGDVSISSVSAAVFVVCLLLLFKLQWGAMQSSYFEDKFDLLPVN